MPKLSRLSTVLAIALLATLLAPPSEQGSAQGQAFTEVTASPASIPQYDTATLLMEDLGGGTIVELSPINERFGNFCILQEEDTYYLWINNIDYPHYGIEQRLESQDGLIWYNRTDTNLSGLVGSYRRAEGLRTVIKNDEGIYEGWQQYYYESSIGWGHAHRYVTSTNGIAWTVVNQPALIGSVWANVIDVENTYHMWSTVSFDSSMSSDPKPVRYRTSSSGGSGWGNWQTGGEVVTVDGQMLDNHMVFVRRLANDTYQLFYNDYRVRRGLDLFCLSGPSGQRSPRCIPTCVLHLPTTRSTGLSSNRIPLAHRGRDTRTPCRLPGRDLLQHDAADTQRATGKRPLLPLLAA